ncbi:MAG: MBL fold metallo-hydrolase, partial [SAR202 cluster bacterium]|nr:MBL fold metallo-hydrolase [SAR202 cluster bacterium]
MSMGTSSVTLVSDGTFLLDGGIVFGQVPKVQWELHSKPDRRNRIRLGLNCLLIQTPQKNILVDTGVGPKRLDKFKDSLGLNGNKLLKGLKEQGLGARDIDVVVLTHLHFDHSGGCTKLDRSGEVLPTFPKAEHVVQKACLSEAKNPSERASGSYDKDDFLPLEAKGL